jgi:hypothetical protein
MHRLCRRDDSRLPWVSMRKAHRHRTGHPGHKPANPRLRPERQRHFRRLPARLDGASDRRSGRARSKNASGPSVGVRLDHKRTFFDLGTSCSALGRRWHRSAATRFFAGALSNSSRLRRYSGASTETGDHCPDASIGVSLPTRLSMNARVDEGELRDRGGAEHEGVEIRQAHAPIY